MAVAPPSWRCELDQLEEFGTVMNNSCEDTVVDDDFYVLHEAACRVFFKDPISQMTTWDIVICQRGQWAGTANSLGKLVLL